MKFSTLCTPSSSEEGMPSSMSRSDTRIFQRLVCAFSIKKKISYDERPHTSSRHSRRWLSCAHPQRPTHPEKATSPPNKALPRPSADTLQKLHQLRTRRTATQTIDLRFCDKRNANPNFNIHKQIPSTLTPWPMLPLDFSGVLPTIPIGFWFYLECLCDGLDHKNSSSLSFAAFKAHRTFAC